MMVFPEGTTNNGQCLMEFKKGAFIDHKPIKIQALTYDSLVNPCWNLMNVLPNLILMLANPSMTLTMHAFEENFNPQYSLDKRGLTGKEDPETTWQYVAEDVYYLMEYGFGLRRTGDTFRDKVEFKKNLNIKVV
jgi:lysophosphatidylcholine acyltransferase/lyso-PAF acetyltransferase